MLITGCNRKTQKNEQEGFTLIELSIVLVIIGLIVGGILTGQDLIKAAEQRATLAQIEKYNTAVNTFRNKFGGVPGDLQVLSASAFGLTALTGAGAPCATAGAAGCGDGNGLIEGGASGSSALEGEVPLFFNQLSTANLVDGNFAPTGTTAGDLGTDLKGDIVAVATTNNSSAIPLLIPLAKLGRANYIAPFSVSGINYFVMTGLGASAVTISTAGIIAGSAASNNLTGNEAYNMDKKVDDGLPGTGSVTAWDATSSSNASFTSTTATSANPVNVTTQTSCINGTSYAVTNTLGAMACSMRFRFN